MRSRVATYSPKVISRFPTRARTLARSSGLKARGPLEATALALGTLAGSVPWHPSAQPAAVTVTNPPNRASRRLRAECIDPPRITTHSWLWPAGKYRLRQCWVRGGRSGKRVARDANDCDSARARVRLAVVEEVPVQSGKLHYKRVLLKLSGEALCGQEGG